MRTLLLQATMLTVVTMVAFGCSDSEDRDGDGNSGRSGQSAEQNTLQVSVPSRFVGYIPHSAFYVGTPFQITVTGFGDLPSDEYVYMVTEGLPEGAEWVGDNVMYTDRDQDRPRTVLDPKVLRRGTTILLRLKPETQQVREVPVKLTVTCAGRRGTAEFLLSVARKEED